MGEIGWPALGSRSTLTQQFMISAKPRNVVLIIVNSSPKRMVPNKEAIQNGVRLAKEHSGLWPKETIDQIAGTMIHGLHEKWHIKFIKKILALIASTCLMN